MMHTTWVQEHNSQPKQIQVIKFRYKELSLANKTLILGDTDEQMMKYIDEQLSKRKGQEAMNQEIDANRYLSPEDAAILSLPKHLRETSTKKSEEMLSNQMLNGIPEINLGIEAKIRNIEATEEAKMKILADQKSKKDLPSQFVPKNYAVNFVQHHRCKFNKYAYIRLFLVFFALFQLTLIKASSNARGLGKIMTIQTQKHRKGLLTIIILISSVSSLGNKF